MEIIFFASYCQQPVKYTGWVRQMSTLYAAHHVERCNKAQDLQYKLRLSKAGEN